MATMIRATLEALPTYTITYPDLDLDAYRQDLITFFDRACAVKARPARRT